MVRQNRPYNFLSLHLITETGLEYCAIPSFFQFCVFFFLGDFILFSFSVPSQSVQHIGFRLLARSGEL
jgi:hypothetical protein